MKELPPASYDAPGRDPVIVTSNGCRVYIHVHDAEYLRQRAEWKQKLALAHPDSGGGTAIKFRRLMAQRTAWHRRETAWYEQFGLTPPDGSNVVTPLKLARPRLSDRRRLLPGRYGNR